MSRLNLITSVIKEYGVSWLLNRSLYSAKLRLFRVIPVFEKFFEKKTPYPERTDLFDINTDELKTCLQSLTSDDQKKLVDTADKACEGIIYGFSAIDLNYGNPIDWQINPLTGVRCSEKQKWYKIPDFDAERGDIKVIWEASRFSHFITLARAFLLTNDQKYYEAFSSQLKTWIDTNPYSFGANYKCGQECSLRMVNALLAFNIFYKSNVATDDDEKNVKVLVDRCYRKVLSNFFYAYKCIKNNHTISELMGTIVGAWCCGDERRLRKAYHRLNKVIDEQFTADGGYRQFSFTYQRLALQDLECVLSLENKTNLSLSEKSKEKIRNAAYLMFQCQDDSFDMPNYGSNDGALVFPVSSCGYRDFRPVINTVCALITGNQLYKNYIHQEELIWFSGGKSLVKFDSIELLPKKSSAFSDAGLFTLRNYLSWAMIVLNDYTSRPAHQDQFHFDLWVKGINVFCDAGTFSYASELGKEFVKNSSHNTVLVDGVPQMSTHGPFMTYNWTERKIETVSETVFAGQVLSKNGYIHSRKIEKTDTGFIITDVVNKDYSVLYHTPCEVELQGKTAELCFNGGSICTITSDEEISIEHSERSLYYLTSENTTRIKINAKANESIKTIIYILEDK